VKPEPRASLRNAKKRPPAKLSLPKVIGMAMLPEVTISAGTVNPNMKRTEGYPPYLAPIFSRAQSTAALGEISTWPSYTKTPLISLPGLCLELKLDKIFYKDESNRFELKSFKALGGAYAVFRSLQRRIKEHTGDGGVNASDLIARKYWLVTRDLTVCCATDGNHGRSVAWAARLFGCNCIIYIHATVSSNRKDAIEQYGARVVRVNGNYDQAVREADTHARKNGWVLISDTSTSHKEDMDITREVMCGYSAMAEEIVGQFEGMPPPTHLFIQGGVGGLAAAVCAHFWQTWGPHRPLTVVVEPEKADCILQSIQAGRPTRALGDLETVMAGLSCGEVSELAWEVLRDGAYAAITVSDAPVAHCMRLLARGIGADPPIVAGESAVAGLAGLLAALHSPDFATRLSLNVESRVLLIGTEGATDPELYRDLVGLSAEEVRNAART
jgi:diaminopropionate ammonia-lyase